MRKLFITLSVVVCSLTFGFQASSQNNTDEEFEFVFLTDIHLEPGRQAVEGFTKATQKVNEIGPDFVLTGGDLIMDALGQTKERADSLYQLYVNLQKKFRMPVYNTPGNHEHFGFYKRTEISQDHPDYGDRIFRKYLGKPYYSFNHKSWHFIVLNSVTETEERNYRGGISQEQIDWLTKDLKAIDSETPIVVSVHIPLISAHTQIKEGALVANSLGQVINNSKEVLELFADKNLKLVLQGHLHCLEDLYLGGKTHFITGGAVSARWWEGPLDGLEEGFLRIRVKNGEITSEYIDYEWDPSWNN